MSRTGAYRDDLTAYLRDHDRRLQRLERSRHPVGTGTDGGGGTGDCADCDAHNDARYVNVGGDTMTGPLVIPGPPTAPGQAANKAYVDSMGGGGTGADEVWIGTAQPTDPALELWYDPDADALGLGFTYVQGVSATVWTIDHYLPFQPNVTIVNSAGVQVEGEVDYIDNDTVQVTFSAAFAGTAYLS